ncbi:MAG: hypothetical protein HDQ94_04320 [Desulfovibrio sp.]|nr:hypothetical protein [Desulfovibrio sp.]
MDCYLASLCILVASALVLGAAAVAASFRPPRPRRNRRVNALGAGCAALGCAVGFAGAVSAFLTDGARVELLWGLPVGHLVLRLDALSAFFLLPVFGLGFVCALSGGIALRSARPGEHNLAAHWFFFLLLLIGMAAVMCAADAVFFLLAWEIMSLAPFFLIDFNDGDSKVRDASWVYLVAAHLGAVFLIAFFVLLWQVTGSTSLTLAACAPLSDADAGMLSVLFVLAVAGFGAKAGIAPLHVWLPEAHPAAPSHVSALLSGAMINAGLYGLIRALGLLGGAPSAGVLGDLPEWWGWFLLLLGLATALLGILKALGQGNLKRLLAYSSVENMGLMFMGVGAGLVGVSAGDGWTAALGFAGALLHMLNHAGFKGLLFLCAGEVLHAAGTVRMELLGGLQRRLPLVGAAFALGAAAIACLPPLSGFASEFVLAMSLLDGASLPGVERQLVLLFTLAGLALVSGLAAAVYVRAYGITFLGEPRTGFAANAHAVGWRGVWPLIIPAAACVAGGLLAPYFFDLAAGTAASAIPLPQGLTGSATGADMQMRRSLAIIAMVGGAGVALAFCLFAARGLLLRRNGLLRENTWGCGYQASSARIQYTAASFAEPLARLFAPGMGLLTRGGAPEGIFPGRAFFSTSAPDRLRTLVFAPLFELVERACNACKILQHGKIHLYILYILATVVGLLVWGLRP